MKISIIGGGSIGLLVGSLLLESNLDVTVYTRTIEQSYKIKEEGLLLTFPNGNTKHFCCKAKPIEEYTNDDDIVFIAVKSYQVMDVLPFIINSTHIVFLQNGITHIEILDKVNADVISIGIVEHGAVRSGLNSVHWRGVGKIRFSVVKGKISSDILLLIKKVELLNFIVSSDYQKGLYEKLIINVCINPLTAILQVKNGVLIENPYYFSCMKQLFTESCDVLQISNLEREELFNKVVQVCKKTCNNDSSMKVDVELGRKTEVDSILLPIIERAAAQNKDVVHIKQIYWLVRGKEI